MRRITRTFVTALAVFLTLSITSCGEDTPVTPQDPNGANTPTIPVPSDAFGSLSAIKTFTEVTVAGFTSSLEFGTAVAVFTDGNNNFSAGDVSCNSEALDKQSNNSYVHIPDIGSLTAATGISLGNQSVWKVTGEGSVPAINSTFVGFPSEPRITSGTTVNTGSGFTVNWNSVTNADSLIITIGGGSDAALKGANGNATSVTFSANDLSGVGSTGQGIIQVSAYKFKNETVSGKKIYYNNVSAKTLTGVDIQ